MVKQKKIRTRKTYSKKLVQEAIQRVLNGERSLDVAKEIDMPYTTLRYFVGNYMKTSKGHEKGNGRRAEDKIQDQALGQDSKVADLEKNVIQLQDYIGKLEALLIDKIVRSTPKRNLIERLTSDNKSLSNVQ
jgi:transposase-like protein